LAEGWEQVLVLGIRKGEWGRRDNISGWDLPYGFRLFFWGCVVAVGLLRGLER